MSLKNLLYGTIVASSILPSISEANQNSEVTSSINNTYNDIFSAIFDNTTNDSIVVDDNVNNNNYTNCLDIGSYLEQNNDILNQQDKEIIEKIRNKNISNIQIYQDTNKTKTTFSNQFLLKHENHSEEEINNLVQDIGKTVNTLAPLFNNQFINNLKIMLVDDIDSYGVDNNIIEYGGLTQNISQEMYLKIYNGCIPEWIIVHEMGHLFDAHNTLGYPKGDNSLGWQSKQSLQEDFAETYTHLLFKRIDTNDILSNPQLFKKIEYVTEAKINVDELRQGNLLFTRRYTGEEVARIFYNGHYPLVGTLIDYNTSKMPDEININHINYYFGYKK